MFWVVEINYKIINYKISKFKIQVFLVEEKFGYMIKGFRIFKILLKRLIFR